MLAVAAAWIALLAVGAGTARADTGLPPQLSLSPDEVAAVETAFDRSAWRGYCLLSSLGHRRVDFRTGDWLVFAARINRPDTNQERLDPVRLYVRTVLHNASRWDGRARDPNAISTNLALVVQGEVGSSRGIPSLERLLQLDLANARRWVGIGGWPGLLPYWRFNLPSGESPGKRILREPAELERFLAINSATMAMISDIAARSGTETLPLLTFDIADAWLKATIPLTIRSELAARMVSGRYHGDPDRIDGWQYSAPLGRWRSLAFPFRQPEAATRHRLDIRRAIRLEKASIRLVDRLDNVPAVPREPLICPR